MVLDDSAASAIYSHDSGEAKGQAHGQGMAGIEAVLSVSLSAMWVA
jgi:hypothetical protein